MPNAISKFRRLTNSVQSLPVARPYTMAKRFYRKDGQIVHASMSASGDNVTILSKGAPSDEMFRRIREVLDRRPAPEKKIA